MSSVPHISRTTVVTASSLTVNGTIASFRAFGGSVNSDRGAYSVGVDHTILVIALLFLGMADFMRFLAVKTLATKGVQEWGDS